jgi:superfamily II DNA or RNA helicase
MGQQGQYMSYTARPYQTEALDAICASYFRPKPVHRQVVMLPTGMGKTVVFSLLQQHPQMRAHLDRFPTRQQKMLVMAHRRSRRCP